MTELLVVLGAAVGAPLRYLLDRAVQSRHDTAFPWGTVLINVIGSFVLGVLVGLGSALPGGLLALLGTGLCGAFTTFSTFSYETVRLLESRSYFYALLNVLISAGAGLGVALLGYSLAA
ncbi:fluoride efflux transporter CrcB [Kutzneria viridogrisea]|uniref:Fluoride-specific ion channel FluC n=2 Tax=Kutzneria TaxID=43356 RepID=W5W401_9PSEU|nr:fluoride efflux transporter CrcB [Kutzneria albida]AHH95171.1 putative membrane protein [Kutzneria albida DSM 43870]MBA8927472.1 CrcB protein [Kutzneria viridogrisea]